MTNKLKEPNTPELCHLNCQTLGEADKPALLLVHGFLSSNLQWEPNKAALLKHFRLFMVELWGHGQSPTPPNDTDYSVSRYVEELEAIRVRYGIKQLEIEQLIKLLAMELVDREKMLSIISALEQDSSASILIPED